MNVPLCVCRLPSAADLPSPTCPTAWRHRAPTGRTGTCPADRHTQTIRIAENDAFRGVGVVPVSYLGDGRAGVGLVGPLLLGQLHGRLHRTEVDGLEQVLVQLLQHRENEH